MGSVEVLKLAGLDLWFNSSDHLPPHFHAERAGRWEVRVFFLLDDANMIEGKWGKVRMAELARLIKMVQRNRSKLLQEWERKVCVRMPGAKQ